MILKKDLIKDKYYIFRYSKNYIVKYINQEINPAINLEEEIFIKDGSFRLCNDKADSRSYCHCVREATPLEIAHLDACIKANKYVECPKEITNEIILW